MPQRLIVLFDGVCNLCSAWVDFVIPRDPKKRIKFAALQSEAGRECLKALNPRGDPLGTILFIEGDRHFTESTAILKILGHLEGAWKAGALLIVIPRPIRDVLYRLIAKNRYRLFGRRDACRLPEPDVKDRFLK